MGYLVYLVNHVILSKINMLNKIIKYVFVILVIFFAVGASAQDGEETKYGAAFLELGNRGVITIYLSDTDIALTFSGEVAHVSGNRSGMKFLHEDIDSMTHLRRLLELNLGSDETITRELSYLIEAS